MDMALIKNLWSKVGPEDDLWIIDDFAFGPKAKEAGYLESMFGQLLDARKHMIVGNYDLEPTLDLQWDSISHLVEVRGGSQNQACTLCQYLMIA